MLSRAIFLFSFIYYIYIHRYLKKEYTTISNRPHASEREFYYHFVMETEVVHNLKKHEFKRLIPLCDGTRDPGFVHKFQTTVYYKCKLWEIFIDKNYPSRKSRLVEFAHAQVCVCVFMLPVCVCVCVCYFTWCHEIRIKFSQVCVHIFGVQ